MPRTFKEMLEESAIAHQKMVDDGLIVSIPTSNDVSEIAHRLFKTTNAVQVNVIGPYLCCFIKDEEGEWESLGTDIEEVPF